MANMCAVDLTLVFYSEEKADDYEKILGLNREENHGLLNLGAERLLFEPYIRRLSSKVFSIKGEVKWALEVEDVYDIIQTVGESNLEMVFAFYDLKEDDLYGKYRWWNGRKEIQDKYIPNDRCPVWEGEIDTDEDDQAYNEMWQQAYDRDATIKYVSFDEIVRRRAEKKAPVPGYDVKITRTIEDLVWYPAKDAKEAFDTALYDVTMYSDPHRDYGQNVHLVVTDKATGKVVYDEDVSKDVNRVLVERSVEEEEERKDRLPNWMKAYGTEEEIKEMLDRSKLFEDVFGYVHQFQTPMKPKHPQDPNAPKPQKYGEDEVSHYTVADRKMTEDNNTKTTEPKGDEPCGSK